ncbi:MAG: rhodanese-like domain-containing protein [Candidatus Binatia bacterium]
MPIQHMTPVEAKELLDHDPDAVYLDVRSVPEFLAGHPEHAINIPLLHRGPIGMSPNPDFERVCLGVLPKEKKLLIGCQVGGRSLKACMILEQKGYTQLHNVCGGFGGGQHPETGEPVAGWQASGLPVSTDNGEGVGYESLERRSKG